MVTACLIALVVIAWFAYSAYAKNAQGKLEQAQQRQFQLTHWTKSTDNDDASSGRILSFEKMQMITEVSMRDGGYLADMYLRQKEAWEGGKKELESDGWTEKQWMDHGTKLFEIRRLSDGTWQGRLEWKRWKADVNEAIESHRAFSNDNIKNLTGVTKAEWEERGDFYDDKFRPWTTIAEDAPAIEANYQRFIHSG